MLYARHLGRAPSGHELEMEYGALGLRKSESKSDQTRFRFDQISRWLEHAFDPEKCQFGYGGYKTEKDKIEALMAKRVDGLKLEWNKGSGSRPVGVAKLAAMYWCMRHSDVYYGSIRFSRKQARTALFETLKTRCHDAEIAAMFRILRETRLIHKVSGHFPGKFGRGWEVSDLS